MVYATLSYAMARLTHPGHTQPLLSEQSERRALSLPLALVLGIHLQEPQRKSSGRFEARKYVAAEGWRSVVSGARAATDVFARRLRGEVRNKIPQKTNHNYPSHLVASHAVPPSKIRMLDGAVDAPALSIGRAPPVISVKGHKVLDADVVPQYKDFQNPPCGFVELGKRIGWHIFPPAKYRGWVPVRAGSTRGS